MVKLNKKLIISIALMFLILGIFINSVYATNNAIENVNFYNPQSSTKVTTNDGKFFSKISFLLSWIRLIGVGISLIVIIIIGIKYILGSPEEKSQYKKTLIPYIVGFAMLLATSVVINLIASLAQES